MLSRIIFFIWLLLILIIQTRSSHSSMVIDVPQNFCELDHREDCTDGRCLRYDPKKFKTSPSIVTYFPGGRLGNMISAFLFLLWIRLDTGLDVYYERASHKVMSYYFENVARTIPILEDALCDWKQFPFEKYEGNIELLSEPEWRTGKAIQIHIDKANFMRHEIQGGRHYYKKYRKESVEALTFRKPFRDYVHATLNEIADKFLKKNPKLRVDKKDLVFVGVHNRRTDYLEFRRKRLGLDNLYEDYFQDAMEYFREEYDNPVFVYVSDDMKWGLENLKGGEFEDMFFAGCGDPDDMDCIGKDFALLSHCNHTITSHGSFGHWATFLAGGEFYTEYGPIVPDANRQ